MDYLKTDTSLWWALLGVKVEQIFAYVQKVWAAFYVVILTFKAEEYKLGLYICCCKCLKVVTEMGFPPVPMGGKDA